MFNEVYKEVVYGLDDKGDTTHELLFASKHEDREDEITTFLDTYFQSEATITGKPLIPESMNICF